MHHKVIIVGFVGRTPFVGTQPDGSIYSSFTVASHNKFTNREGQPVDIATWWTAYAYGRWAEIVRDYLTKGRPVYLEGMMIVDRRTGGPRPFTRKDGSTGSALEIKIQLMRMLGDKPKDDRAVQSEVSGEMPPEPAYAPEFPDPGVDDEFEFPV